MILKLVPTGSLKIDGQVTTEIPAPDHEDGLIDDIRRRGVRVPLLISHDLYVIDGYRRLAAAKEAGIDQLWVYQVDPEPANVTTDETEQTGLTDPGFDALTLNAYRRHLNPAQRAALGLRLEDRERRLAKTRMKEGARRGGLAHRPTDPQRIPLAVHPPMDPKEGVANALPPLPSSGDSNGSDKNAHPKAESKPKIRTTDRVAKLVGISRPTYEKAKKVFEDGPVDLAQEMKQGKISIAQAYKKVKAGELRRTATEERTRQKAENWTGSFNQISAGRYRTIICDPDWKAELSKAKSADTDKNGEGGGRLAGLDLARVAHSDGCHLYLVMPDDVLMSGRFLPVIKSWGFKPAHYVTLIEGQKRRMVCLVCTKRNIPFSGDGLPLDIKGPLGAQGDRSPAIYRMVRKASVGPHLEMFGGKERRGFDGWGAA